MEINIGDKVRFLNDVGGGTVTKILDKNRVMVENQDGFDVPSAIKELIVVERVSAYDEPVIESHKAGKAKKEPKDIVVDTRDIFYPSAVEVAETGNDINLWLAFVPQERPGNSDLNVFLINDSNYNVLYSIINRDDENGTYGNNVGVLEANVKENVESLTLESAKTVPEYIFHFVFYKKGSFAIKEPMVKEVKISPVKFFKEKSYKENEFFNENAIMVPLVTKSVLAETLDAMPTKSIEKIIREKEKPEQKVNLTSPKKNEKEILEVDLHIQELLDNWNGLSNSEILEIQMKRFRSVLEDAKRKGPKRVVFIHGVGNGTLKLEIRKELQQKKYNFQDASFKEYGYGATMVTL